MKNKLVFQLGTNNWQRQGEFAPDPEYSTKHTTTLLMQFLALRRTQSIHLLVSHRTIPKVDILALNHEIPICESVSPVSSYRFHSMSDEEFNKYKTLLKEFTKLAISKAEQKEGTYVDLAIATTVSSTP